MKTLKILLVDDDDDDRNFFSKAIESLEVPTTLNTAIDGQKCLDYLKNNASQLPDLIFLDLNMPLMDGFECLDQLKSKPEYKDIIIAIYSTSSSERDIEKTFVKGAHIYINKPSNFNDLKVSLNQVLKTNWTYKTNNFDKDQFLMRV